MSLAPGVRLGPYEIVTLLGVGGMGEVYEARDTRLDCTVACLRAAVAAGLGASSGRRPASETVMFTARRTGARRGR